MLKRLAWTGLLVALALAALTGDGVAYAEPPQQGSILYESRPDEIALYLSDLAFVRDHMTFPPGQDIQILLPPGTYPNTMMLTEGGERVHHYRITPQTQANITGPIYADAIASVLSWQPNEPASEGEMREVTLEYMLSGASWSPTYDMVVVDDNTVSLAFFCEVRNSRLTLDDATVYLVAGRVDLSEQVDQVPMVTMNQYLVGYSNETVTLPALGMGAVQLQHVYELADITAQPGDIVYVSLADATLAARRMNVWNAAAAQEIDVIYKVLNDTELPLAEGIVRVYQDGLFRGSDFIETTPVGSEGSITIGSLPDVRVRRSESEAYESTDAGDFYVHTVTLEISNHGREALDLTVLDVWDAKARSFEYSQEPAREPDNILRWEVSVPPGDTLTITYRFETDY